MRTKRRARRDANLEATRREDESAFGPTGRGRGGAKAGGLLHLIISAENAATTTGARRCIRLHAFSHRGTPGPPAHLALDGVYNPVRRWLGRRTTVGFGSLRPEYEKLSPALPPCSARAVLCVRCRRFRRDWLLCRLRVRAGVARRLRSSAASSCRGPRRRLHAAGLSGCPRNHRHGAQPDGRELDRGHAGAPCGPAGDSVRSSVVGSRLGSRLLVLARGSL